MLDYSANVAYMGYGTTSRSIAMSGGRPAVYKNRPIVEDATRAGWRSWKPPPKGAPCAGLDPHPRRQPGLARGRAPRRARPGAERAPVAASGRQPAVIGVSLAETAETPRRFPAVTNVRPPPP